MIYLHYKDTKTFGHSFSFLLIFKTLRASYLQVGNFSYTYWSMIIYVCDQRVIVSVSVNTSGTFYPYILTHGLSYRLGSTSTFGTATTSKMIIWPLFKKSMFRANYFNWGLVVDIFHHGIVISIPMYSLCLCNKFFYRQLCHNTHKIATSDLHLEITICDVK